MPARSWAARADGAGAGDGVGAGRVSQSSAVRAGPLATTNTSTPITAASDFIMDQPPSSEGRSLSSDAGLAQEIDGSGVALGADFATADDPGTQGLEPRDLVRRPFPQRLGPAGQEEMAQPQVGGGLQ